MSVKVGWRVASAELISSRSPWGSAGDAVLCSAPPQGCAHRLRGLLALRIEDVAVDVGRDANRGVPEEPGDDLQGHALCEEDRGAGVPELVGTPTGKTRLRRDPVEDPAEVRRVHGRPCFGGEDKASVVPGITKEKSFGGLPGPMRAKGRRDLSRQVDLAPASFCLRRTENESAAHARKGLGHGDDAVIEVDSY